MKTLLAALLLLASTAGAAEPRHAVFVHYTSKDSVGIKLIYQIKETLRASKGLSLAPTEESSRIVIAIVTLDPTEENMGASTAYAAVWRTKTFYYLHHVVGVVGGRRVEEQAQDLVAQTDQIIDERFRK